MRKYIIVLLLVLSFRGFAQELNCMVQVTTPQIQTSDRRVFETLQTAIREFMNDRKWTNYSYKYEERIECSILINVSERPSTSQFKASIQIQSRRPIFNTSYNSVMLNYIDKQFEFEYEEYEPLDFDPTTYTSNLTSVLAFYAYFIIGLDFDSYSLYGGTPFFEKAQTIINNAQNAPVKGWKAFESRKNRYWLIENVLNQRYSGIRECLYKYHRLGLDLMYDNKEKGRAPITEGLKLLQQAHREKPGLFFLSVFFLAKRDELVSIYKEGSPMDKPEVVKILSELDPSNSSKYRKIQEVK